MGARAREGGKGGELILRRGGKRRKRGDGHSYKLKDYYTLSSYLSLTKRTCVQQIRVKSHPVVHTTVQ